MRFCEDVRVKILVCLMSSSVHIIILRISCLVRPDFNRCFLQREVVHV